MRELVSCMSAALTVSSHCRMVGVSEDGHKGIGQTRLKKPG